MATNIIGPLPTALPIVQGNVNTVEWVRIFQRLAGLAKSVSFITATCNPTAVGAANTSEQTFTVTGVSTTDYVMAVKPTHTAGLIIGNTRVSAADTVAITFGNLTAGSIDPPSETYTFLVIKV